MIQKQLQGEKVLTFTKCIEEKNAVICQELSFYCGPLATRLFRNLNSTVYLQGMFFFFSFTPTLLFPEPRYDLVKWSAIHVFVLVWFFFLSYLSFQRSM